MGGIFSQEISSEEEVMKIQDSLGLTPSQRLPNPRLRDVRLLSVDPRSPTDFISRTPIVVEKTPELQAKKMKPSCVATDTLQEGPAMKDPRSPTKEFTRTPINPCHSSSVAVVRRNVTATSCTEEPGTRELQPYLESANQSSAVEPDPNPSGAAVSLLKNPESGDTSVVKNPESGETSVVKNPGPGDMIGQESEVFVEKDPKPPGALVEAAEPYNVADAEDSCDVDCEDVVGCGDNAGGKATEVSAQAVDNKLILKVSSVEESTPKLSALIPAKSDNRIRMKPKMLSLQPSIPRSPLCAVQNSPRILSDRYSSLSNGSKTTHSHMTLDKENVFH